MNRQKNIYGSLPPKRLFTSNKRNRTNTTKTVGILVIVFCGFVLLSVSFTLPSFIIPPKSEVEEIATGIGNSSRNGSNGNTSIGNSNANSNHGKVKETLISTEQNMIQNSIAKKNVDRLKLKSCSFRRYKSNRYYKVDDENKEDFLSNADYIRGELPFILNPRSSSSSSSSSSALSSTTQPTKLCLDTSKWEDVKEGYYPFSDGQNPSIISLSSNVYNVTKANDNHKHYHRLDSSYIQPLKQVYGSADRTNRNDNNDQTIDNLYLGLLLFGDSQCRWDLTADELDEMKFSPLQKPPNKRSMVVILNNEMEIIDSTVLKLVLDKDWGGKRKNIKMKKIEGGKGKDSFESAIVELDDSRLFFHNGRLNVLYRNGPYYGYDKQVQNPIHFKVGEGNKIEAFIKASETFTICCGRNIAFISELPTSLSGEEENENELQALTWIDPVTTEMVNPSSNRRRLTMEEDNKKKLDGRITNDQLKTVDDRSTEAEGRNGGPDTFPVDENIRRFLKSKTKKSHIHGTNGYMIPLHSTSELLGIAHFHRPEGRDQSPYARHGHHYTHAFFTIQLSSKTNKYFLKRLSNEFIFMSPSSSDDQTGDVIQFASGLDLIGSDIVGEGGKLLISYGINDCEAATFFMGIDRVQELLVDVEEGHEVVSLMQQHVAEQS
eukprot:CAMPEP_0203666460 /NCGR_PEP_ID=MMETSP0090-20130426/3486_1 /ASSEMBLY_ACC=CAM_ASM_001088 /TAXON_ID=426623 /ORGANISM="Chaetoceros affinis, Strain CCMP159" /LENGTH=660 /DNA_ID=CAMNT_0050530337 /DNA_START=229 /DNA_END=2211 /DNA_ORIENTATION=+